MKPLALALSLLLPGVVAAQAATYTYINQKTPHKNPSWAMLTALNLPKLGTTFKVQVPYTHQQGQWAHDPIAFYSLAIGVSNPNLRIPSAGWLFTSAEVVIWSPWRPIGSTYYNTLSFAIPNSAQLLGTKFYQQVLVTILLQRPPYGWSEGLSRGGIGTIGK